MVELLPSFGLTRGHCEHGGEESGALQRLSGKAVALVVVTSG